MTVRGEALTDYRVAFVDQMRRHMEEGMNFAEVVQETLADTLGRSPSQILFKMIGKNRAMRPELFVERVPLFLEDGARGILAAVERRAHRWREVGANEEPASAYESLLGTLVTAQEIPVPSSGVVLLHNHRIRDQLGSYAEDD